jgi:hypothetical protein
LLIYGDQQKKTVKNCAQKWVAKQSGKKEQKNTGNWRGGRLS